MMQNNDGIQFYLENTWKEVSKAINITSKDTERYVNIVLGNEGGDLDSIVSTVVYAYFMQKQVAADSKELCVPVMNFDKGDVTLKTDVNAVFEKCGLSTSTLVYRDTLVKLRPILKTVTLVDHNELNAELTFLREFVTTIIDHHIDSESFKDLFISKTVESVGSCCTLIAEKVYNKSEFLFTEYPISDLILSAILSDTVNLKPGIGRTTEKDVEFVEELQQYASFPLEELFDTAQKAKYSILHLSVTDMLRKDLKVFTNDTGLRIGVSSITASAEDFLARADAIERTLDFSIHNSLSMIMIMFIHVENGIAARELAISSHNSTIAHEMMKYLLEKDDLELQLQKELENITIFTQGNSAVSRKVLAPYVMNFLSNDTTSESQSVNYSLEAIEDPQTEVIDRGSGDNEYHHYTILDSRRFDEIDAKYEIKISEADSESPDENEAINNLINRSFEDPASGLLGRFEDELLSRGTYSSMHSQSSPTVSNKSFNEGDTGIEQPSLEFDESWKLHMYEVKSPDVSSDEPNQKHKIVLRDLSFDDNAPLSELTRIDLLCPVFLAVTEDEEDDDHVLKDIRRKTKSIENLASTWDDDQEFPLRRTKSELPPKCKAQNKRISAGKRKRLPSSSDSAAKPRHDSIKEECDASDENPFIGNRELGDNVEHSQSTTSSSQELANQEELFERGSCSNSESEAIESRSRQSNDQNRPVLAFSFSEDEPYSCEANKSQRKSSGPLCSCKESDWSTISSCPHHVKGLWERFITVSVSDLLRVVDLKLIDPYVKVISHGGFHETTDGRRVVMVFTADFLPKKYIPKYSIIMEQLFYYVVHTIDLSVLDSYEIVYFSARGSNQPGHEWMRKCYDMVERRLKKNLHTLYIVHPDFWFKTMVRFYKPFMSSKFSRNIEFIKSLRELKRHMSLEYIFIPDEVKRNDPDANYWLFR